MSTTRARLGVAMTVTVGLVLTLGTVTPASAAKSPKVTLTADGSWFTHPVGWYEVVVGRADIQAGKRTVTGDLVANVRPDDSSMPAAGTCERGSSTVEVDADDEAPDVRVTGVGDLCGHHVQEPTSAVVYSFTGVAYSEQVGSRRLHAREGFIDIRMAHDGRASVFATSG
jgi:hypothetical protein